MSEGKHDTNRNWLNENSTCAKTHPSFKLNSNYVIVWSDIICENIQFYYTILKI